MHGENRIKGVKRLTTPIIFALLWQFFAMILDSRIFPSPLMIITAMPSSWSGAMFHTAYSVCRIIAGVVLSLCAGVPLGVWIGYDERADGLLSPLVYFLAPVPKIALLPLIMLLFGIGDSSKVFIIFIVMVFQVTTNVRDAVKQIPDDYFLPLNAVRAKTPRIISHIVLPAILPSVFSAVRIGFATSVSVLFFAETFGTRWGMGFYVMDMWMQLKYTQMYLGIVILGIIGYSFTALTDILYRIFCPWCCD